MSKWATENELVPAHVHHGLQALTGLWKGRSEAKESEPVQPVAEETVNCTLPHIPGQVRDMVRLQLLSGCRPGEICLLRPCDVNRDSDIWEYTPESHKTEHHGRDRLVFFGLKARQILTPYLDSRPADAYCFSPAEAEQERHAAMRSKRKTPVQPSQRGRSKPNPRKQPGERYSVASYGRAIKSGCKKARVST